MIADWDAAYDNAAAVAGSEAYPAAWGLAAAAFRAEVAPERRRLGLAYGRRPRERLDLFLPEGRPAGVAVFVHGGYWRRFDRDLWSHLAAGPLGRGWAVAIPGYPLAPEARIAGITASVTAALDEIAAAVAGPIRLVGHSAGGQLAVRQVCAGGGPAAAGRIDRVLSISGLHDLRPLLGLELNAVLRLDEAEAAAESPALLGPRAGARVHVWVGDAELPEFVRQSTLLANIWTGLRAEMSQTIATGRHHYDVIEPLADPDSDLVAALID